MATVQELYQQILGREPEPAGLLYWENQFGGQVDPAEVERFQAAAASELAQRQAESAAASNAAAPVSSGGAAANVEALYESQLGRAADPGGLAYWTNKFGNEIDANEAAQFQAAAARELAQRSSQQAVEALYASQLGRASDPEGLAYWTNRFGSDINANELAEFQAAAAREVAARTAGVPPPRVTTPPPRPVTPTPTPAPRVTAPPPGTLPPPTRVTQPPVYSGGTGGTFIGGGSPGYTSFMPFSNAGQGLAENFANYQSIPIGSQYNPGVTAGGFSPYEQVMGQMRPLGNPYANVMAGQAMGGYDPALYDQILANNAARAVAANAGVTLADYYGSGGGGGDSGDGGGGGDGNTGGGPGTGAAGDAAFAKGGIVRNLLGPNPPGPDDGAGYLQNGEYVIKKSSVNKYGKGLLDMINEGKVPAKKMKSLLG
jgi:hypothetical protein